MSQTNLSKIKPSLRTSGAVTGNFGRAKVKSGSNLNDVPVNQRDSVGNFPRVDEYAKRLREAYSLTSDQKLKAFIVSELRKIERTAANYEKRHAKPQGPYCSLKGHFIDASR